MWHLDLMLQLQGELLAGVLQEVVSFSFLAHLAYMPMSLCNHDLSVMCHCCWCHHCHCHHCWCHHLCTAVPVTALLIETLYLADTCTYILSIFT